jgi:hypothetical protein
MPESTYTVLPKTVEDREFGKFELDGEGKVRVRTTTEGTLTGEIRPSGLTNGGKVTEVTINSATWTALPPTALTDRNALGIQNVSAQDIKINFDNGVSGFVGMVIGPGSERTYDITDQIVVYAKSSSGTITINVEEIS